MDDEALRAYVDIHYRKAVGTVALVCGDLRLAEDAVQEALASAWERGGTLQSPPAWIMHVALNRARSRVRRRNAEQRAYARWAVQGPQGSTVPELDDEEVVSALRKLPVRQREVVVLHYYADMSVTEVAATLGVADGTVKTSLHRARLALRETLGAAQEEGLDAPR